MDAVPGGVNTWWSLLGAAVGAGFIKLLDSRTRLRTKQIDVGVALRDELHKRLEDCETECNAWKDRYYEQLSQLAPIRGELAAALAKIQRMEASEVRRTGKPRPPDTPAA